MKDTRAVPSPVTVPSRNEPPNTAINWPIDLKNGPAANPVPVYDSTDLQKINDFIVTAASESEQV